MTLAKELGAMVFTYKGEDIAGTILRFAREYQVGHIVTGSPAPIPFWKWITGMKSIPERLMEEARGVTIVVLDTRPRETTTPRSMPSLEEEPSGMAKVMATQPAVQAQKMLMSSLLDESGMIIWNKAVDQEEIFATLVRLACHDGLAAETAACMAAVREREAQGSTFYNEGVAFPHARVAGLERPLVALGLTRMGVSDVATEKPVRYVFLSLSPYEKPEIQLQLLALAGRAFQNRYFLKAIDLANDPPQVYAAIRAWDDQAV
jgi:two-component system sensor histidine kinase KdpD